MISVHGAPMRFGSNNSSDVSISDILSYYCDDPHSASRSGYSSPASTCSSGNRRSGSAAGEGQGLVSRFSGSTSGSSIGLSDGQIARGGSGRDASPYPSRSRYTILASTDSIEIHGSNSLDLRKQPLISRFSGSTSDSSIGSSDQANDDDWVVYSPSTQVVHIHAASSSPNLVDVNKPFSKRLNGGTYLNLPAGNEFSCEMTKNETMKTPETPLKLEPYNVLEGSKERSGLENPLEKSLRHLKKLKQPKQLIGEMRVCFGRWFAKQKKPVGARQAAR